MYEKSMSVERAKNHAFERCKSGVSLFVNLVAIANIYRVLTAFSRLLKDFKYTVKQEIHLVTTLARVADGKSQEWSTSHHVEGFHTKADRA